MQLFITSRSPERCAMYLDDRRLNKIIVESAQMLSTAVWTNRPDLTEHLCLPYNPNHPVTKWVRATRPNYLWTADHHTALIQEKHRRTGKWHSHACRFNLGMVFRNLAWVIPDGPLQKPANAARRADLGLDFTAISPTTLAYRMYLEARWQLDAENGRPPYCSIRNV